MAHRSIPFLSRPVLVGGLLAVALTLAACGRKGPLDLPPAQAGPPPANAATTAAAPAHKPPPAMDAAGHPIAPPGPKRHIFLDNLID